MHKLFQSKTIWILLLLALALIISRKFNPSTNQLKQESKMEPTYKFSQEQIIPRQILFGNPEKVSIQISPNGRYISYLAPIDNIMNLWIAPLDKLTEAKAITNVKDRNISGYSWAYNNDNILYAQDYKGDENYRIYSYSVSQNKTFLLTPAKGVRAKLNGISHLQPNSVLISHNHRNSNYFDLYKYDLLTHKSELIYQNDEFGLIFADRQLKPRIAFKQDSDGTELYFKFNEKLDNKKFMEIKFEDSSPITFLSTITTFLGFDLSGENVYMLDSRKKDKAALYKMNMINDEQTLIASHPKADITGYSFDPKTFEINAYYAEYIKKEKFPLNKEFKEDLEFLQAYSPKSEVNVVSTNLDNNVWIVAFSSDILPTDYYVYYRDLKELTHLFNSYPALADYQLNKMHTPIIKTRDNLEMVSYLTMPSRVKIDKNFQSDKAVPMVLLVHGGPWYRDNWGLNRTHQWLSNRGYAVLSVNFRGSSGFGKDFVNASNLQWGKKMHDDLIDAVNWAVKNNIAQKDQIVIMGGSYGGYATLVGMTKTPEIFAAGIDIVGPSNLLTLIETIPPYWKPLLNNFRKRMGAWETEEDKEKLREVSPLFYIDNIKKPLLILQGAHDPRVKQSESDQIVDAMHKKNIPVSYVLYHDEGHGFANAGNRISSYAIKEIFLSKVINGRFEEAGNDLNNANFHLNNRTIKDNVSLNDEINNNFISDN